MTERDRFHAHAENSEDYQRIQEEESANTRQHPLYQKLLRGVVGFLANKIAFRTGRRILDVGCGDGWGMDLLRGLGFQPVGVDLSPVKIRTARAFGHEVYECDMEALTMPAASFDAVLCSHALEHSRDAKRALAEMHRVLKDEGLLLIVVPLEGQTQNPAHTSHVSDPAKLIRVANELGFDVVEEHRHERVEREFWMLAVKREGKQLPRVVLEFDDFSPINHRLDLFRQLRERFPKLKVSLFTVPNQDGRHPLDRYPAWCGEVRELDFLEFCVHGLSHSDNEFAHKGRFVCGRRLREAERIFLASKLPFQKIFRAPRWQIDDGGYSALADLDYAVADHTEHMTPSELRCYQYNWSINDPLPSYPALRGHGHVQNVCGNGIEECFDHLMKLPRETEFMFVSEYLRLDASILSWTRQRSPFLFRWLDKKLGNRYAC